MRKILFFISVSIYHESILGTVPTEVAQLLLLPTCDRINSSNSSNRSNIVGPTAPAAPGAAVDAVPRPEQDFSSIKRETSKATG